MESFLKFLKASKNFVKTQVLDLESVHLVLGNESCDLDSSIAALTLAYFLHKQTPKNTITIPILNVSRADFKLHTESTHVLQKAEVSIHDLVYRDDINFKEITSKYSVVVSLVDHHVLSKNDEILAPYVREIIDHRPVDSSYQWDSNKVQIRIEPVGSCCTLIADKILKSDPDILCKSLAYLLYQTIIYDTIALNPENHKATPLDIDTGYVLEQKFGFVESRQEVFDKLWQAHNDVSHLTPLQLLSKDLKLVGGIYVPGLPMLVEDYLRLPGAIDAVEAFVEDHKVTCILLIGLNASNGKVERDLAVYSRNIEDKLRKILLESLMKADHELDCRFEKRKTSCEDKIDLLHVYNIKLSRKQMVPVVKSAWKSYSEE
ncbi:unnamed protein product [Ceutorhynchus assimilis]|uniref:DHHA2 domain-containing protein n=1 Tax=Ceutorhynchus assimilis TaxID=467358 RepID=A0A9N9MJ88_9CUCU|nr:unnamed protein product [Ceutorhynchus assimilis]